MQGRPATRGPDSEGRGPTPIRGQGAAHHDDPAVGGRRRPAPTQAGASPPMRSSSPSCVPLCADQERSLALRKIPRSRGPYCERSLVLRRAPCPGAPALGDGGAARGSAPHARRRRGTPRVLAPVEGRPRFNERGGLVLGRTYHRRRGGPRRARASAREPAARRAGWASRDARGSDRPQSGSEPGLGAEPVRGSLAGTGPTAGVRPGMAIGTWSSRSRRRPVGAGTHPRGWHPHGWVKWRFKFTVGRGRRPPFTATSSAHPRG